MKLNTEEIRKIILPIMRKYGVTKSSLFGSCTRKDATEVNDIDILVELNNDLSLLDFVGLKIEIEEALNKKVDLVEYNTLKPTIKDKILGEQVKIL